MQRHTLQDPITTLGTVAARYLRPLHSAGISTFRDLLFYYPYRYEDWSALTPVSALTAGNDTTVQGMLTSIAVRRVPWRSRPNVEAVVRDARGDALRVVWYNSPFLAKSFTEGIRVILSGKVEKIKGVLQLTHPQWIRVSDTPSSEQARIMAVYHLTGALTQKVLRNLVATALRKLPRISDYLPSLMLKKARLISLDQALRGIHLPRGWHEKNEAEKRLKFDELFFLQLRSALARREIAHLRSTPVSFQQKIIKTFVDHLPFPLTQAQRKAAWEIIKDMQKSTPMNRLLEGDVGSGKTAVAALSSLDVVAAGHQVAYLAPTSILATQHFTTFSTLFETSPLPIRIGLLTQGDTRLRQIQNPKSKIQNDNEKITKKDLIHKLKNGEVNIVIGTHALLSEKVQFPSLALVIVDEQHRFGVRQRHSLLRGSAYAPHLLTMTATPIPRTLALAAYGDLDLSILDEMPKGRATIMTKIIEPHQRADAYDLIHEEIKKGRQAFIICPLIDPSDTLGIKSVKAESERLKREHFPHAQLAMLHGRMSAQKKDGIMKQFADGLLDVLVATPVVEVGIDVPNATVTLIEGAERFGLAQLHQLRGRVGRSTYPSHCLLATDTESETALMRLHAVAASQDGFALAEKDLEMRGPGEVFGTQQAGFLDSLKIAKLTDAILLKTSKEAVDSFLASDPALARFPAIRERLVAIEQSVHLE